jgi:hydrogenase-4 component E
MNLDTLWPSLSFSDFTLAGLSHLLGGGVLLLSFMLLVRRRPMPAINGLAAQGGLLALVALCHAAGRDTPQLLTAAALLAAGQGLLLPLTLREWVRRLGLRQGTSVAAAHRPSAGLAAGVALVLLAVLALLPVTSGAAMGMREDLVLALSVMLLGLLVMAARHNPLGQAIGLGGLMNGALLGVLATPGLPLLPAIVVVAMAIPLSTVTAFLAMRPPAGDAG